MPYPGRMPKHSSVAILRRWMDMDRLLAGGFGSGLNVREFARRWRVNERTVRRDLAAFRAVGREMVQVDWEGGRRRYWVYCGVKRRLFHQ